MLLSSASATHSPRRSRIISKSINLNSNGRRRKCILTRLEHLPLYSHSRQCWTNAYGSPRERAQNLPRVVQDFKIHGLFLCITDTPIHPFMMGSDDVDHLLASCWDIILKNKALHGLDACEEKEDIDREISDVLSKISSLMTFCGLPSPWEAANMLKLNPALLSTSDQAITARMVELRALLPDADLPTLVRRKPGYLSDNRADESIQYALDVLEKLMPHVNVQQQMAVEQNTWLTFSQLVDENMTFR